MPQEKHDCIRQGDILFEPIRPGQLPIGIEPKKDGIIAEGEVTGHHHRIDPRASMKQAALFMAGLTMYLRVFNKEGVNVVHEEHGTVHVPQGDFEVHHAQEHDYLTDTVRQVAD